MFNLRHFVISHLKNPLTLVIAYIVIMFNI